MDLIETKTFDKKKFWALIIGVYQTTSEKETCNEHLEELQNLVETYGAFVKERVACPLKKTDSSTFLGSGKVDELAALAKEIGAEMIIFDDEIRPSQQRNLEKIFNLPVLDRTEIILDVFAKQARSNEAKLQIEYAGISYQLPRLKRLWTHLSRQRGGGVNQKGEGEKQIELDKRMLNDRKDRLGRELKEVVKHREVQRVERERTGIPQVAIIGYTNSGKSTLLNLLTDAGTLVEDKLFATLDTTTRRYSLPNEQPILITDTVGFVRKLPHMLVAAFRSTLEEALQADILVHLIDVSHSMFEEHAEATFDLLGQLGAKDYRMITVCNKIDQCEDLEAISRLELKYPNIIAISAKTGEGIDNLLNRLMKELESLRQKIHLKVPQSEYQLIHQIRECGRIISEDYEDNDVILLAELDRSKIDQFKRFQVDI